MKHEIKTLIADNNDLEEKINTQNIEIMILKDEVEYLQNFIENNLMIQTEKVIWLKE